MRVDQVVRANQGRERAITLLEHARHALNDLQHCNLYEAEEIRDVIGPLKNRIVHLEDRLRFMQLRSVEDLEEQFV